MGGNNILSSKTRLSLDNIYIELWEDDDYDRKKPCVRICTTEDEVKNVIGAKNKNIKILYYMVNEPEEIDPKKDVDKLVVSNTMLRDKYPYADYVPFHLTPDPTIVSKKHKAKAKYYIVNPDGNEFPDGITAMTSTSLSNVYNRKQIVLITKNTNNATYNLIHALINGIPVIAPKELPIAQDVVALDSQAIGTYANEKELKSMVELLTKDYMYKKTINKINKIKAYFSSTAQSKKLVAIAQKILDPKPIVKIIAPSVRKAQKALENQDYNNTYYHFEGDIYIQPDLYLFVGHDIEVIEDPNAIGKMVTETARSTWAWATINDTEVSLAFCMINADDLHQIPFSQLLIDHYFVQGCKEGESRLLKDEIERTTAQHLLHKRLKDVRVTRNTDKDTGLYYINKIKHESIVCTN